MGEIREFRPVLRVMAVSSRHDEAFDWTIEKAVQHWGPLEIASPPFDFSETGYYQKTMGEGLKKQLLAFTDLIPQDEVVESKLDSNQWEEEFKSLRFWDEPRPINLDPGYITEAKLVLATTKDRDHRIYLRKGIFAEVTLFYQDLRWQSSRWTYPDYERDDFHVFFDQCRDWLRDRYAEMASEQDD
ncbi:DUF4416 family protein [Mariniblastus fucicola]|uniref:GTP-binding protein n=1 Tax=Mariniblastus fucicola TaxID=980251 RepID=A0A5B9PDT1_9BACT|nr:DUF4416 family protein [Mariniblastus fucicola]QEG24558.1 hypothetical protein MFFC18_44780 [Mariniblastus fucicola]